MRHIREQLIPKIKGLCADILGTSTAKPAEERIKRPPTSRLTRIEIVAVGISTGGPNALDVLIPALPAGFPMPVLVVQHMPPIFTRHLAERLASRSAVAVSEAANGDNILPGKVLIAPGGLHMNLQRDKNGERIRTHSGEPENSCRPSVDVLFRSVAQVYGPGTLAVVMTGMGQDGTAGSRHIRQAGGTVLVQDEATSVVWGRPGSVVRAGLASMVLPLSKLADEIIPALQAARRTSRCLRIWCGACSTGQESYSIAMMLTDHFPELSGWSIQLLGTDISDQSLERARQGVYNQFEAQRGLQVQSLLKYFTKVGQNWQISEDLRRMVSFQRRNRLDSFAGLDGPFDIMFVRNVLIYFENAKKDTIFSKLRQLITADGYLLLGESETVLGLTDRFTLCKENEGFFRPV